MLSVKSTSNPDIDKVHQTMIDLMNEIAISANNGGTVKDLKVKLNELYLISKQHFIEEEKLMHDIDYPFSPVHIMAHEDILSKIKSFLEILEHTKKDYSLLMEILIKLVATHVENYDVALFLFKDQLVKE